jgi:putative oxidoreductase
MNLALLVLHVVVGLLFFAHGTQKLFGWFGGHGIEGTAGFFDQLGMHPGRLHAWAAAFAETVGGICSRSGCSRPSARPW